MAKGKGSERPKLPVANDNSWLGNTVTHAKIQEIGADNRWHTLGECIDTPNAIKKELEQEQYQGHDIWVRDAFGDRCYIGTIKKETISEGKPTAKILTDFAVEADRGGTTTYPKAYQYGQVVYVPIFAGNWRYARLYELSSRSLVGLWEQKPINGEVALVKRCAQELGRLDWQTIIQQQDQLPHERIHELVDLVNEPIRRAGGRTVLSCPDCARRLQEKFCR